MNEAKTFELTIHPEGLRNELIRFLADFGIEDYVEAASDSIDADDVDWEEVLADWSEKDDSPLLIYRSREEDFDELKKALTITFDSRIRLSGKWIADSLWQEAWQSDFLHLETEQFFISSPEFTAPKLKIHILLKEAAVFGSGQHATTQALVRLMEEAPRITEPKSFLDIGTGTGVLAFVAHHLGYSPIVGTDIEDNAIENAQENAQLNKLPLVLHLGSQPPETKLWDTIACNILPPTLTHLLEPLTKLLKDDGTLYLAGFHEANSEAIEAELKRLGFSVKEERKERGWIGWLAMRGL
ncbi:MAG: methyltransferase domain-containing protein [Proteobacteria bacterium]|nr:MAG: methyltransferase domain-containing protein [Pseudomonadota bacterium]